MKFRVAVCATFLLIAALPSFAGEKPWVEVRSPHFRILTNGSANDARKVAHEFEQMRFVFENQNPQFHLEGGAPLTIFAAEDEPTAKSLEPFTWKLKGAKPSGIYHHAWEREYVMMRLDEWNLGAHEVVYHEYTHSILHRNLHWIPVWLDEGMADYYGFTRFQKEKIYVGAPPPRYRIISGQTLIPIDTLVSVNRASPYYHNEDKVYLFYAESWALVHFLMFGPGMDHGKKLNEYSALLEHGMESKKAFQQVFGDFKTIESQLRVYTSQFAFQVGVVPNPPQIEEKSFDTRSLTMAETKAELAGFHLWTHDMDDARRLADEAVKLDPKLGFAHEVTGWVDFADGKDDDARKEFAEASDLDPTLPLSLFAKTMMSPIATSNDPADENSFHDALSKVVTLNPRFAPAFVQLGKLALRRNDLQTALACSRKAEQLEPMRAGYHIMSGQILHQLGRDAEAANFARSVAERWPGADHDEAVELWNAIPEEQHSAGDPLVYSVPKDTLTMDGRIVTIKCSGKEAPPEFTLKHDGKTAVFQAKGPFESGFSDTLWYGSDHFGLCHHLEGMRAIVRYKPSTDPAYAGEIAEIEIRDELPEAVKAASAK